MPTYYATLHGDGDLPPTLRCACGRTFKPEKDRETYCSTKCARKESMQALLGKETLYKQNNLRQQAGQHASLTESPKPRHLKRVPAVLNLRQDEQPPAPLPKSARHMPRDRRPDEPASTVPPLPHVQEKGRIHSRRIPPTPPPKSARHICRDRGEQGSRTNVERAPPVPVLPPGHINSHPSTFSNHAHSYSLPAFDVRHGTRITPTASRPAPQRLQDGGYTSGRIAAPAAQALLPLIYAPASTQDIRRQEVRRSRSLPFLHRPLDPNSRLGMKNRQQAAIYAPTTVHQVIPFSPPPAYTSGPIYGPPLPRTQADSRRPVLPPSARTEPLLARCVQDMRLISHSQSQAYSRAEMDARRRHPHGAMRR